MTITTTNRIPVIANAVRYIKDNSDYEVTVSFDSEWNNKIISAVFVSDNGKSFNPCIVTNGKIKLPMVTDDTKKLYIGFTAVDDDITTTNPCSIVVEPSVKSYAKGEAITQPEEDVYSEIIQKLTEALKIASDSKTYRDEALAYRNNASVFANSASALATQATTAAASANTSATQAETAKNTITSLLGTAEQLNSAISGKVDKVDGKGLSTNDYDNTAKSKVDAIPDNPKYTDTVYDDTSIQGDVSELINDLSDLETVVDGKANSTDVYNKSTVDTKLSAKQNTLTDADKQSITKTGLTTGGAWSLEEAFEAKKRIHEAGDYETICDLETTESVDTLSISIPNFNKYTKIVIMTSFPKLSELTLVRYILKSTSRTRLIDYISNCGSLTYPCNIKQYLTIDSGNSDATEVITGYRISSTYSTQNVGENNGGAAYYTLYNSTTSVSDITGLNIDRQGGIPIGTKFRIIAR